MTAYYNEHDAYAAQWLRNLIDAGHIAPGIVDERSIEDVFPSDLRGFTQCHFFAGIGVWSHALRRSGWADSRPVWTGSCPCQPFSSAGQGAAFDDERHLWPAFHHLIKECKPAIVIGEQVASKDADPWIDLVQADVEAMGYAFGAIPFPSAGVGAPHIRDRLYWVANADGGARGKGRAHVRGRADGGHAQPRAGSGSSGVLGWLGHSDSERAGRNRGAVPCSITGQDGQHLPEHAHAPGGDGGLADNHGCGFVALPSTGLCADSQHDAQPLGIAGGMADTAGKRWPGHSRSQPRICEGENGPSSGGVLAEQPAGPTNSLWRDADWLLCRDGKWRPVEPGTFPLVDGAAGRVGRVRADQERIAAVVPRKDQGSRAGRLKGYGNAINAVAAEVFVSCVMEATC